MIELYDKFYDWCESTFEPDMLFILAVIFFVAYIVQACCYCKLEKEHELLIKYMERLTEDVPENDEVEHEQ